MGSQDLAFATQEECFIKMESNAGELIKPTAGDRVFTIDPLEFPQDQEKLPDEQIRAGASRPSPIKGRKMAGEWSGTIYGKPSGAPGTAPEADVLFECLFGVGGAGGGGYRYTLANLLPSFSFWSKKGHTVFAGRGATVNTAAFTIAGDAITQIAMGGMFMELGYAGTTKSTAVNGAVVTLDPGGSQLYTPNMYVQVGGAGSFRILSVHFVNNTITLDAAPGGASVQAITPWWPAASAEVGKPVHGKTGIVTVDGQNAIVLSATVEMNNNIKYYDYEKNDYWTAEKYGRPGKREVDGSLELHFLERGPSYWYRAEYQVQDALVIPAGKIQGYIMELGIPFAEYLTPSISGDEEFIQTLPFQAVSQGVMNDELTLTFK